jgi:hypothetical protein
LFTASLNKIDDPDVIRPGEQCVDGIYMTPDGFSVKDNSRLHEWKYTTKSSATSITDKKFSRWTELQIPAYLWSLGLTECRLRVYHACGDYRDREPVWMDHVLSYAEHELEETWDWIRRNAETMKKEGLV